MDLVNSYSKKDSTELEKKIIKKFSGYTISAPKDSLSYIALISPYLTMLKSGSSISAGEFNIAIDKLESFIDNTDRALANISSEPVYYVDYIYTGGNVNPQDVLTIGGLKELWGKDFNEAMVAIKDLKISKDMVQVYRKSNNTLKITLPNKVNIMKFNATDEECEMLENQTGAYVQMDIVGTCHINEFFGNVTPQIFIEEYEITGSGKYLF